LLAAVVVVTTDDVVLELGAGVVAVPLHAAMNTSSGLTATGMSPA
jgi:tRNA1(Val) A37 N6-methylase TrmN6